MKLKLSVFNKTQVITAFLPQAMKIAELLGCDVQIKSDYSAPALLADLNWCPMQTGIVTELEISVQGDEAWEALTAMRLCMSQCYRAVNDQLN